MKKVFTTGTFDILHYGHISLLRRAKALGDYLIVGVNVNPEGKEPFYSYDERKEILMSIKYVDEVIPLYKQEDKFNFLKYVDVFACGSEYRGYYDIERIEKSVPVVFLERTPGISTTKEKEVLPPKEQFHTICVDIDDTLSYTYNRDFENSIPNTPLIEKVNAFHQAGWKVILSTARGGKSCRTLEERIAKYKNVTETWLKKNGVLYDELWFGKPNADFYIDDKNMSLNEFTDFQIEYVVPFSSASVEVKIPEDNNIDIIVPWVDENDMEWRKSFNEWKDTEIRAGIQKPTNLQAFGEERVRDWEVFKYWFRAVEKNCPWVHKVFLVVQRESQIPEWLDRTNPKLRIVYHDEFIPKEMLPVFSTLIIETFYCRIPDLSNHFIVCNDDFYFLNPIPQDLFFKDGKCHYGDTIMRRKSWSNGNSTWSQVVHNNDVFLEKNIIKHLTSTFIHYSHLPDGRVKEFERDFMNKYYAEIYAAMKVSRFRHPNNLIPSLLFIDAMKYQKYSVKDSRVYKNSCYKELRLNMNWNDIKTKEMVCLNDTAAVGNNFEIIKKKLIEFFEGLFPEKCSFEK